MVTAGRAHNRVVVLNPNPLIGYEVGDLNVGIDAPTSRSGHDLPVGGSSIAPVLVISITRCAIDCRCRRLPEKQRRRRPVNR